MLPLADLAAATEAASGGVWDTGKWLMSACALEVFHDYAARNRRILQTIENVGNF